MNCNDLRLMANQIIHDIWAKDFPLEEKLAQLEILKNYIIGCEEQLNREK